MGVVGVGGKDGCGGYELWSKMSLGTEGVRREAGREGRPHDVGRLRWTVLVRDAPTCSPTLLTQ